LEKREFLHKRLGKQKRDAGLLVLKRLIKGPAYPRDLRKELKLSRNVVYYHISRFIKYGIAKKLKDKRYAFIDYVEGEEVVVKAVKKWKDIAFRYPTIMEIADETGIKPEDAELLAYKTKGKTGWFRPNQGVIETAREKLGEALVCAARIRDGKLKDGKSEDFDYENDPETLKEGENFLKNHPELLPKLSEDGEDVISWSSEALKYLGKIYKPKDRSIPHGWVVPR